MGHKTTRDPPLTQKEIDEKPWYVIDQALAFDFDYLRQVL